MAVRRLDTTVGPIGVAGVDVVARARETSVRFAFGHGGGFIAYSRPRAVEVRGPEGTSVVPVPDIEFRLLVVALVLLIAARMQSRRRSR